MRKVYHVWGWDKTILGRWVESFEGTYTSFPKAKEKAIEKKVGYNHTVVSSYNLETHQHLDIWISLVEAKE
jgi:hypothetical protein